MSVRKLQKFIERPLPESQNISKHFVLVSDSKGCYLRRVDRYGNITYICRGGATFRQQFYKIKNSIFQYPCDTHFLIWLGTCDLTQKDQRYISLRDKSGESDVHSILYFINQFKLLFSTHGFKYTFLEVPPYTIEGWNQAKGHPTPNIFKEDDIVLSHKVALINDQIRLINYRNDVVSPKFILDLCRTHRSKKGNCGTRHGNLNYSLYTDGIHPTVLLSECWLRSIVLHIYKCCT